MSSPFLGALKNRADELDAERAELEWNFGGIEQEILDAPADLSPAKQADMLAYYDHVLRQRAETMARLRRVRQQIAEHMALS